MTRHPGQTEGTRQKGQCRKGKGARKNSKDNTAKTRNQWGYQGLVLLMMFLVCSSCVVVLLILSFLSFLWPFLDCFSVLSPLSFHCCILVLLVLFLLSNPHFLVFPVLSFSTCPAYFTLPVLSFCLLSFLPFVPFLSCHLPRVIPTSPSCLVLSVLPLWLVFALSFLPYA